MSKRFRVAFSFSGAKRAFVAEVAALVAARFGRERVLYDKFHQAEFARSDLAFHLPAVYHEEADLVVVILCADYTVKEWCGLEWSAVFGLVKERRQQDVMLCRFDQVDGQGLFGLAGFVDLDEMTPSEAAGQILERLALNEGHVRDHYVCGQSDSPDWPAAPPPLEWPVADHRSARLAFSQLITRSSSFRILLIRGSSETGKSHLTNQFLRNGLKIPHLTCGRFDFKGSADMDGELHAFAARLGVPAPTRGSGVSSQLGYVLASLTKAARPVLLIFDTFELAGDADRWVRENLLLTAVSAGWLRVIIVGQRVPVPHGEPWEADSAPPIESRLPTPEDWFDYGRSVTPASTFTLELVRQVHELVSGKTSVLAQLCRSVTH